MLFEVKGWIRPTPLNERVYEYVAPFILGMVSFSVIGFTAAQILADSAGLPGRSAQALTERQLELALKRFFWIPVACVIVGLMTVSFLFSVGGFDNLDNYRLIAVTTKRSGYGALAQRLSGHLSILGSFYLMIVGYKQAVSGIKLKETFKYLFMIASVNLAIGGRVWLVSTSLPWMTGFFLARATRADAVSMRKSARKLILVATMVIGLFSMIGMLRSSGGLNKGGSFFTKFLYYTDGPKIANMVLKQYPPGTFQLEYGKANFLTSWVASPMTQRFAKSIEHDVGLSVTVRSTIPAIYYDFGYCGGLLMWGVICGILEFLCLQLKKINSLMGIVAFGSLATILYQSPVGSVLIMAVPVMEWLMIIYVFRRSLFGQQLRIQKL